VRNFPLKLIFLFTVTLTLAACTTKYENRNPLGNVFPTVKGESLEQQKVDLPKMFAGKPTLLLLGYVQNAQFDIDRWLIGLDMTKTKIATYEVPTISGMFPKFFETQINNGMRKGIPKELWKGVITIYADGEKVQSFTGNENPNNARVILLDAAGKVIYFDDRGFSVSSLNKVRELLNSDKS
jgi:hypothetical protein